MNTDIDIDKFAELSARKCDNLDTLIYNFKAFVVNEIENNSYVDNGTLYYVDYKIPTSYIAKYGKSECMSILELYFKSNEIERIAYVACNSNDRGVRMLNNDVKRIKQTTRIKENMFAKYIYAKDDEGNIDEDNKHIVNHCNVDGIIYPIVISK